MSLTPSLIVEILGALLLTAGGFFAVIGSFGLLRLKDSMQRLHAPTKATTLGIATALVAVAIHIWTEQDRIALREVLVAVFFFVTAPISALFLSKAHIFRSYSKETLPPTGTGAEWATLSSDPETPPPSDAAAKS